MPGAPSESPRPVVRRMLSIVLRIGPAQLRVGALDPYGDVGVAEHAVEIDEYGHELPGALGLGERLPQEARLAEVPRREEAHVVAAGGERQELLDLGLPVEYSSGVTGRE